jgi:hypothetical protein
MRLQLRVEDDPWRRGVGLNRSVNMVFRRTRGRTFVCVIAKDKVYKAKEKYNESSRQDTVHEAEDEDENSGWQVKAILKQGRLNELGKVPGRFRPHEGDWI